MNELRTELTDRISAITDLWDEPLNEVHDIPQIVNAVLACHPEHTWTATN